MGLSAAHPDARLTGCIAYHIVGFCRAFRDYRADAMGEMAGVVGLLKLLKDLVVRGP